MRFLALFFARLPSCRAWLLRRSASRAVCSHNVVLEWLQQGYHDNLARLLRRPVIVYVGVAVSFAAIGILGATVGREFLPNLDEGSLWLQVQMPTGISLDKASEMAGELRLALKEFPEVDHAITQLGRSDDQTDPWTPSHIEAPVTLTPYDTWPGGETKQEFLRRLSARFNQLPGFDIAISQPIIDNVNELVSGAHSPLVVKIFGEDFNELRRIGGEIVDVLNGIRGTAEASIAEEPPIPQITIQVDRAAAARYGINVSDVVNLIQTGIRRGSSRPSLYRGPGLQHICALSERGPRQSRGLGRPHSEHGKRRPDPALASRHNQAAKWREQHLA
jgi:heavy metal efflux system protein